MKVMFKKISSKTLSRILAFEAVAICCFLILGLGWFMFNESTSVQPNTLPTNNSSQLVLALSSATPSQKLPTADSSAPQILSTQEETMFSVEDAQHVSPNDILQEVSWYAGGIGGPICADEKALRFVYAPDIVNWLTLINIETCGWQVNERINVHILNKSGDTIYSERITADNETHASFRFWPGLNSKPGKFKIILDGTSGILQQDVTVFIPTKPRFYIIHQPPYLILYNFAPDEKIRILAYRANGSSFANLIGWNAYQADEKGRMFIPYNEADTQSGTFVFYVAVREQADFWVAQPSCYQCSPISVFSDVVRK